MCYLKQIKRNIATIYRTVFHDTVLRLLSRVCIKCQTSNTIKSENLTSKELKRALSGYQIQACQKMMQIRSLPFSRCRT